MGLYLDFATLPVAAGRIFAAGVVRKKLSHAWWLTMTGVCTVDGKIVGVQAPYTYDSKDDTKIDCDKTSI